MEKVEILSAKEEAGSWRVLLRGDMENLLNGIVQRMKLAQGG